MISGDSAVIWAAVLCTAIAYSFDAGKNAALDSLAHQCLPQPGEILVSVQQRRNELTCIFAPAEYVGYRAKRTRRAT